MQLLNRIRQEKVFTKFFLICLVVLSALALVGVFHKGFFVSDDGNWMVIRFSAFYEAFRSGQFPVRFLPRLNNGFGYPVADFLYPLFMYIGIPIHIIGFNFIATIKIIFGASIILSGICTFFWLKKIFSNAAAFIGALTYIFFPYHLWDMYKRGSVGEVLALAVVPFIFWQIEEDNISLISLGIALLVLAHNTIALLIFPVLLCYLIIKKISPFTIVCAFVVGLASSAFFWFPALFDKQYTVFDATVVSTFNQFFIHSDLYILFGMITIAAIINAIYRIIFKKFTQNDYFFLIIAVVSIFLSLPVSQILWKFIPITQFIQFPFRLLSISVIGISFLVASNVNSIKKPSIIFCVYLVVIFLSAIAVLQIRVFTYLPDTFYSTNQDSTTVHNEYMPKTVKKNLQYIPDKVQVVQGNANLQNILIKGSHVSFTIDSKTTSTVRINFIYFPGWKVFIDGVVSPINIVNEIGVMEVTLPAGNHTVQAYFGETTEREAADIVSIVGFIILVGMIIKRRKHSAKNSSK